MSPFLLSHFLVFSDRTNRNRLALSKFVIHFNSCFICILVGVVYGRNGSAVGWTECGTLGSEIGMELDLRSEKKEERTLRFIVDKKIQKCCIVGLPADVRFRVCPVILLVVILILDDVSGCTGTKYSGWVC